MQVISTSFIGDTENTERRPRVMECVYELNYGANLEQVYHQHVYATYTREMVVHFFKRVGKLRLFIKQP